MKSHRMLIPILMLAGAACDAPKGDGTAESISAVSSALTIEDEVREIVRNDLVPLDEQATQPVETAPSKTQETVYDQEGLMRLLEANPRFAEFRDSFSAQPPSVPRSVILQETVDQAAGCEQGRDQPNDHAEEAHSVEVRESGDRSSVPYELRFAALPASDLDQSD